MEENQLRTFHPDNMQKNPPFGNSLKRPLNGGFFNLPNLQFYDLLAEGMRYSSTFSSSPVSPLR